MPTLVVSRHYVEGISTGSPRSYLRKSLSTFLAHSEELGLKKDSSISIVHSPSKRTVQTAEIIARELSDLLERETALSHAGNVAFGEDVRSEDRQAIRRGGDILHADLSLYDMVWLITHGPLVEEFFNAVCQLRFSGNNPWVSLPDYIFGIHAVSFTHRTYMSFGLLNQWLK